MKYIKSCGFIAYKLINNKRYYLIIKAMNNDIGFPKGRMEENESELQTAFREVKEETNIDVELIDGFRYQTEYNIPKKIDCIKRVVYFLGKCINKDVLAQESEVKEVMFLSYEEGMEILTFNETKKILKEAEEYLQKLDKNK